jgi:predicted DNA-binding transcriptional regulator AlpA
MLKLSQSNPSTLRRMRNFLDGHEDTQDALIPRKEAAKMLGVSRATFWRMTKSNAIPVVEIFSGIKRVRMSDIRRIIESQTSEEFEGRTINSSANCIARAVKSSRKLAKFPSKEEKLPQKMAKATKNIAHRSYDGKYYLRIGDRWQRANSGAEINRILRIEYGIKSKKNDEKISEIDRLLHHCFKSNDVCLGFKSISG